MNIYKLTNIKLFDLIKYKIVFIPLDLNIRGKCWIKSKEEILSSFNYLNYLLMTNPNKFLILSIN
jgi:hypothetical protein